MAIFTSYVELSVGRNIDDGPASLFGLPDGVLLWLGHVFIPRLVIFRILPPCQSWILNLDGLYLMVPPTSNKQHRILFVHALSRVGSISI